MKKVAKLAEKQAVIPQQQVPSLMTAAAPFTSNMSSGQKMTAISRGLGNYGFNAYKRQNKPKALKKYMAELQHSDEDASDSPDEMFPTGFNDGRLVGLMTRFSPKIEPSNIDEIFMLQHSVKENEKLSSDRQLPHIQSVTLEDASETPMQKKRGDGKLV